MAAPTGKPLEPNCSKGLTLAERTGLEPAASGVTGRRYNQLNYRSSGKDLFSFQLAFNAWWAKQGLNLRHPPCKGGALPTELFAQVFAEDVVFYPFDQPLVNPL